MDASPTVLSASAGVVVRSAAAGLVAELAGVATLGSSGVAGFAPLLDLCGGGRSIFPAVPARRCRSRFDGEVGYETQAMDGLVAHHTYHTDPTPRRHVQKDVELATVRNRHWLELQRILGGDTRMNIVPRALRLSRTKRATERAFHCPVNPVADLWRAPFHDFPIRDFLLYTYWPLASGVEVLEVGPGSGYTAFRLARRVRHVTVSDIHPALVEVLDKQFANDRKIRCVCVDVTSPDFAQRVLQDYDAVFALDVLEYVSDPAACLQNMAKVLVPGGGAVLDLSQLSSAPGRWGDFLFHCGGGGNVVGAGGFSPLEGSDRAVTTLCKVGVSPLA